MNFKKSYSLVFGLVAVFLLTACGGSGGGGDSSSTIDYKEISYYVPEGVQVLKPNAVSEKANLFLAGEHGEVSGFFLTEDSQAHRKSKLEKKQYLETILYSNINGGSLGTLSLISSQKMTLPYEYTVSHYKMSTYVPMKPLALSEKLLYEITGQSNIEPLNSEDGTEASEFRVIYTKGIREGAEFQIVSIVPESKYEHYESMCNDLTNGTRVTQRGAVEKKESQSFNAKAGNRKADFLFIVDDSGSMADDQDALSKSASDFTAEMRQSGLNYRSAIITTSSQRSTRYDLGAYHILNSVGIIENNEELLKESLVAGIYGSNTETGIYNAEQALLSIAHGDYADGEVTKLGMPLSDATLSVIIISDEPSQYSNRAGYQFDVKNNLFINRNIRVYSIIESYGSTTFDPYDYSQYDDLATETGGTFADIRNTNSSGELDYSDIMKQIAKDAGGAASTFVLDHPAISVIEVTIDKKVIKNDAKNGYTYNQSSRSIVLHGTALPESDFTINVYYTHVDIINQTEESKELSVPYLSQKDKKIEDGEGYNACLSTSSAMVLAYHGEISNDKQNMINEVNKMYPKTLYNGQVGVDVYVININKRKDINIYVSSDYKSMSLLAKYTTEYPKANSLSEQKEMKEAFFKKIKKEIDSGRPMLLGSDFAGVGGHYIVVRGYKGNTWDSAILTINDPFGEWKNYSNDNGENLKYKLSDIFMLRSTYPTIVTLAKK